MNMIFATAPSTLGRRRPHLALTLALGLLSACAQLPKPPSPAETPAVAPVPVPATEPAPAAPPSPEPATQAPTLSNPQEVQKAITAAIELLQAGQEEPAEAELKRVLQIEPGNRQAQSLLRQMRDDPIATLGRESFAYRVQPGESLSRIAQRFLNDLQQFYILARYNNIKVPRTLAEGQTIRIPGKAPATLPAANPAVTASPAAAPGSTPAGAAAEPAAEPAGAAASPERLKAEAIARHTRDARGHFAKQDLDAAIRSWDAVLKLDPENRTAFLEREKVVGLREKLGKLK